MDELEAVLTRRLNGDISDPLRDVLMQGLNPQQDDDQQEEAEQEYAPAPIALNDDAALTAKILNAL